MSMIHEREKGLSANFFTNIFSIFKPQAVTTPIKAVAPQIKALPYTNYFNLTTPVPAKSNNKDIFRIIK